MVPAGLENPFASNKLDDTATLPQGDVPELHAPVLDRCGALVAQARQNGQGVGLLVVGEAGSGKSHLIAQLRKQLAAIPTAVLIAVPMKGAFSGRLWRHLRERLVTELLRQYPTPAHGSNGLLRILRNRFPRWAAAIQTPSGGLMDWLLGRSPRQFSLEPFLTEFAQGCPFDYGLQRVLPSVANSELTAVAHAWLRGQQLGSDDLQRLGLPTAFPSEQQQEIDARNVVLSFLRLAGDQTVLFICFDEVEAIQSGTWDAAVLRQFTTLATDLVGETGPRVVATFIRPSLQIDIDKAVEVSNVQKLGQFSATIPPLTWEQVVRVTVSRLEAEPTCKAARLGHPGDQFWPLCRDFLETTFQKNKRSLTPRHLLLAAQVEFERLKKGGPEPPPRDPGAGGEDGTAPPPPPPHEFTQMWGRHRNRFLERLQGVQFDTVMGIGLPWLAQLTGNSFVRVQDSDPRLADLNLLLQHESGEQKPVGVSFCNHDPRTLWRRLDRVLNQWNATRGWLLGTLIVLRPEIFPPTDASRTRFDALSRAGVRVLMVTRQQLAELAAFQSMLTASLAGDLTRDGRPVPATEYTAWARENLSRCVADFVSCVFIPADTPTSPPPTPAPKPATKHKVKK